MQREDERVAKFYKSKLWQRVRRAYFINQHGLCERCGKPGDIVHHKENITTANIYDPNITINFDNLELVCQDCHNKEHMAKFDEAGELRPKKENLLDLCGVYKK